MIENNKITSQNKLTIAYAEDERWFREPMVEMLLEGGFEVLGAFSDGAELLRFTKNCATLPDLFLTDLRMPNMNGLQLTEEILSKWPNSKVVILTSEVDVFYVREAKKVGAVGFLHKIIDYNNVGHALREVYQANFSTFGKIQ